MKNSTILTAAGLVLGAIALVLALPPLVDGGITQATLLALALCAFIVAAFVIVLAMPYGPRAQAWLVLQLSRWRPSSVPRVRSAHLNEMQWIYDTARAMFGHGVTPPATMARMRRAYNGAFFVLYRAKGGTTRLCGYYCLIPIQQSCVDRIRDGTFDITMIEDGHMARKPERAEAIYLGAVAGTDYVSRQHALEKIELAASKSLRTRSKTLYARAGTKKGLNTLQARAFKPVNPTATGVGAFYFRTVTDADRPRTTATRRSRRTQSRRGDVSAALEAPTSPPTTSSPSED